MFLLCSMYCTLSSTVCTCKPCQQSKPQQPLQTLFSRGHDPFAHACKARPLTIVGRTSLSVSLSLSALGNRHDAVLVFVTLAFASCKQVHAVSHSHCNLAVARQSPWRFHSRFHVHIHVTSQSQPQRIQFRCASLGPLDDRTTT